MRNNRLDDLDGRYWLTAKAARLLGHEVPDDIDDDRVVIFDHKETR